MQRARQVSHHVKEGDVIQPLPTPLLPCDAAHSARSGVIRYNERSKQVLEAFLSVKDWRAAPEETLHTFVSLLQGCL